MSLPMIGSLTLPTFFIGFLIVMIFRWFNYKDDEEPEEQQVASKCEGYFCCQRLPKSGDNPSTFKFLTTYNNASAVVG
jgi:hypothetical protein